MASRRVRLNTLTFDIGGTGLKATVLDAAGEMVTDRHRIETRHPMTPDELVEQLQELAAPMPHFDRISVGFPGVVRGGRLLSAHNFVGKSGPGTEPDPELVAAWRGFGLDAAIETAFGVPTLVVNDADLQGFDVVSGEGVEVVITFGTGVGSALFEHGRLAPHLEMGHAPFRHDETYEQQLGDVALERVGPKKWSRRLLRAIESWDRVYFYDRLYLGGGNSRHINVELPDRVSTIDPNAGLLAGIKLWRPGALPGR